MMDFSELAALIEAFADANDAFKAEHKADYNSAACHAAYELKTEAGCAVEDAWDDALEGVPRELAAALRDAQRKIDGSVAGLSGRRERRHHQ